MSLTESRQKQIPIDAYPGYQRIHQKLQQSNPKAIGLARELFEGEDKDRIGGYLPLLGIEDNIAMATYKALSIYPLHSWKNPESTLPYHIQAVEIALDPCEVTQHLDLSQSREIIPWELLTYRLSANVSGKGGFGDIEGYELVISNSNPNDQMSCKAILSLDSIGLRVKDGSNANELSKRVVQYFRDNPDHATTVFGKAALVCQKTLKERI